MAHFYSKDMPMRFAMILVFVAALMGCSTKYQSPGLTGGVAVFPMGDDVFRVESRGNGYTSPGLVKDYALLAAAEKAVSYNATHFIIVSREDASSAQEIQSGGIVRTSFTGNGAVTSYSPPLRGTIFRPGEDMYIRILNEKPGRPLPEGAYSASEIIRNVGSRVERG
jgi:hypothetical protein